MIGRLSRLGVLQLRACLTIILLPIGRVDTTPVLNSLSTQRARQTGSVAHRYVRLPSRLPSPSRFNIEAERLDLLRG